MKAASSNSGWPGAPMKLVATPRPEKNDWKSMVGPWMDALRPPAHSTWATLRPPRSALWAIDSAWRTPLSNEPVLLPNACPLMWKVLLVEPVTPGQAPVARLYQPAPVFGGASVRRPLPVAEVPFLRKLAIVGRRPCAAYFATRSWRRPSAAKRDGGVGASSLERGRRALQGERRCRDERGEQRNDGQQERRAPQRGTTLGHTSKAYGGTVAEGG